MLCVAFCIVMVSGNMTSAVMANVVRMSVILTKVVSPQKVAKRQCEERGKTLTDSSVKNF